MTNTSIYEDIAKRTDGALYIGVIGPVRTGKSTFIKRFMESVVLPEIQDTPIKERMVDEMPQSAAGKTIMTTEPKFIPEKPVEITMDTGINMKLRMIDCVGYVVPSAMGYIENNAPRMIKTPWYEEEIPFNMAAEIGTKKVITDHSTIGVVITTDGSITDIPREEYALAEKQVIEELKQLNKPFVVLINSIHPSSQETLNLQKDLQERYGVSVITGDCTAMEKDDFSELMTKLVREFPIQEIDLDLPSWLTRLNQSHTVRRSIMDHITHYAKRVQKMCDIDDLPDLFKTCEYIENSTIEYTNAGEGKSCVSISLKPNLFYQILSEVTKLKITSDTQLMETMKSLVASEKEYNKVKSALKDVEETGYGIVMPEVEEMELDEPEIIRQSGRYGVRLRAQAPSIHMMKATIETEVSPIVGSERQSEELVAYLLREFEENPVKIWDSNIFGTSLYGLVNEGLHNKLCRMPMDARMKMKETVERVINEGCNGLICIIV